MNLSRREMLRLLAGAAAVAAGTHGDLTPILSARAQDAQTPAGNAATTGLPDAALATLTSLVAAVFIVKPPEQTQHYARMLRARAEQDVATAQRYLEAAKVVNERAGGAADALDVASRRALIEGEIGALANGAADGSAAVRDTILNLLVYYLYTDAYIAIGYEAWPGVPRGFDAYRQPLGARS